MTLFSAEIRHIACSEVTLEMFSVVSMPSEIWFALPGASERRSRCSCQDFALGICNIDIHYACWYAATHRDFCSTLESLLLHVKLGELRAELSRWLLRLLRCARNPKWLNITSTRGNRVKQDKQDSHEASGLIRFSKDDVQVMQMGLDRSGMNSVAFRSKGPPTHIVGRKWDVAKRTKTMSHRKVFKIEFVDIASQLGDTK